MFADPLNIRYDDVAVKASPTLEAVPFRIKSLNGQTSVRAIASSLSLSGEAAASFKDYGGTLSISHQETGKGAGKRTRSRVRFDVTPVDATATKKPISVYLVLDRPSDLGAVTDDVYKQAVAVTLWLRSFMTDTNLVAFLDGNV